ncbi:MAG: hypothetical protein K2N80_02110 [Lachnospiraceae bacterium]|nr:hypothetical protein [Lachnospiraceae bacterium]
MGKVYCIIKRNGNFYFPVKSKAGPYQNEDGSLKVGYLAGMPNFFGGTVNRRNKFRALWAEVLEESQDKISIGLYGSEDENEQNCKIESACQVELFQTSFQSRRGRIDYDFYLFDGDCYAGMVTGEMTIADFGAANRLALATDAVAPNEKPERREMACILKIPENRLPDNIDGFLDLCIEMGGDFLLDKGSITSHRDWNDEGTRNAFEEFCRRYGHRRISAT